MNGNMKEALRGHLIEFQRFIGEDDADDFGETADHYLQFAEEEEQVLTVGVSIIDEKTGEDYHTDFRLYGRDRDGKVRAAVGAWITDYLNRKFQQNI